MKKIFWISLFSLFSTGVFACAEPPSPASMNYYQVIKLSEKACINYHIYKFGQTSMAHTAGYNHVQEAKNKYIIQRQQLKARTNANESDIDIIIYEAIIPLLQLQTYLAERTIKNENIGNQIADKLFERGKIQ